MISVDALRDRLVGHRLPGGQLRVEPYEASLAHDAMRAEGFGSDVLHPLWIFVGGVRGMGTTIEALCALMDASPVDGVLFGELGIEQRSLMRAGVDYEIRGAITDVARREGKRIGTFDVMTFRLEVLEHDGAVVGTTTSSFVFPRRA